MNTPITDAETRHVFQWDKHRCNYKAAGIMVDANLSRRLETDRAALIEAMQEWLDVEDLSEDYFVSTGCQREPDHPVVAKSRAALSAARENFPTP